MSQVSETEMDEPRACYAEWSKSEREKQILYINAHFFPSHPPPHPHLVQPMGLLSLKAHIKSEKTLAISYLWLDGK